VLYEGDAPAWTSGGERIFLVDLLGRLEHDVKLHQEVLVHSEVVQKVDNYLLHVLIGQIDVVEFRLVQSLGRCLLGELSFRPR